MRKVGLSIAIALLLGCFISTSVSADGFMLRARFAGQLAGNYNASILGITANTAVNNGFSIGAEGLFKILRNLQLGAGLEYEFGRQQTLYAGNFEFVPLYGVVRVPFDIGPLTPYAIGRIGYGLFSGDPTFAGSWSLSGGIYYGLGGGIDLRFGKVSIFAEGTYSADNGSGSNSGLTLNVLYTRIDLSAGVALSL